MQSNKDKIKPAHRETKLDSCKLITDFYNGHLVITDILVSPEKSERERAVSVSIGYHETKTGQSHRTRIVQ